MSYFTDQWKSVNIHALFHSFHYRIRRSTLLRLRLLSSPQYRLSDVMRASLSQDPLAAVAPLLTEPHLSALDRRLATVLQTIQRCLLQHPNHHDVVYDDITDYSG